MKENLDRAVSRRYNYKKALESGNWAEWQRTFREELRSLSGLAAIAAQNEGLPLSPRADGVKHLPTYTRGKWYIQSEPGIEIAFYLLLPNVTEAVSACPDSARSRSARQGSVCCQLRIGRREGGSEAVHTGREADAIKQMEEHLEFGKRILVM
jgi:hypothetical protein